MAFSIALKESVLQNENFRDVVFSVPPMNKEIKYIDQNGILQAHQKKIRCGLQLVFMSLKKGETIEEEIHVSSDQFIRVESGKILVTVEENKKLGSFPLQVGDIIILQDQSIIIPKYTPHSIIALEDTKLYTIYGSNEHRPGDKEPSQFVDS